MRNYYSWLVILLVGVGNLNALNLDQAVEKAVSARTPQKARQSATKSPAAVKKSPTPAKKGPAATSKPKNQNTWYGLPVIDWNTYQQLSAKAIEKQEKFNQLSTQFYKFINLADMYDIKVQQGIPNYRVVNTKYIYIGEVHDTPLVQREINKLIRVIRQANRGKKILLATEFLQTRHPFMNPLHIDGKDWLLDDSYYDIVKLADQLGVDTLALDDNIIMAQGEVRYFKAGKQYVKVNMSKDKQALKFISQDDINEVKDLAAQLLKEEISSDALATFYGEHLLDSKEASDMLAELKKDPRFPEWNKELTRKYGPGNTQYLLLFTALSQLPLKSIPAATVGDIARLMGEIEGAIGMSLWGRLQRNYQWAERIKQVEKNYDVVIVWAGNGHFDSYIAFPSVNALLNHPDAVEFDFIPLDDNNTSEELAKWAENTSQELLQQQLDFCVSMEDEQLSQDIRNNCQGIDKVDMEQTFFVQVRKKPGGKPSAQAKAIQDHLRQLDQGVPDGNPKVLYQVYLK